MSERRMFARDARFDGCTFDAEKQAPNKAHTKGLSDLMGAVEQFLTNPTIGTDTLEEIFDQVIARDNAWKQKVQNMLDGTDDED